MDVIKKIKDLAEEQGWTEYRLVKESSIAASTISNIFHRNTLPNIITLESICNTFGITLSQFFFWWHYTLSFRRSTCNSHWMVIFGWYTETTITWIFTKSAQIDKPFHFNQNSIYCKEKAGQIWTAPRQVDNWKNINFSCQQRLFAGTFYATCK